MPNFVLRGAQCRYPGSELYKNLQKEGVIKDLDNTYFEDLMTQFDFTLARTYCDNINSIELLFYRILGMGVFYILSYLRCPSRLLRLFRLPFSKTFQPISLFEQRVYDSMARLKLART